MMERYQLSGYVFLGKPHARLGTTVNQFRETELEK